MPNDTYYPRTKAGRAAWWKNIADNGSAILSGLGFATSWIQPIIDDAKIAQYVYGTLDKFFDHVSKAVTEFGQLLLNGPSDAPIDLPNVPALPGVPSTTLDFVCGLERRREDWVQEVKKNKNYTPAAGALLGIEASKEPFNYDTYQCELYAVHAHDPHTIHGKFRKAAGRVEGINLYGRKNGATAWTPLGRYTAASFGAAVPVTGPNPEVWEFQARAVRKDVEFGVPSVIIETIVRP